MSSSQPRFMSSIAKPKKVTERKRMVMSVKITDVNEDRRQRRLILAESARKKAMEKLCHSTPNPTTPTHSQHPPLQNKSLEDCNEVPTLGEGETVKSGPHEIVTAIQRSDSATGHELVSTESHLGSEHETKKEETVISQGGSVLAQTYLPLSSCSSATPSRSPSIDAQHSRTESFSEIDLALHSESSNPPQQLEPSGEQNVSDVALSKVHEEKVRPCETPTAELNHASPLQPKTSTDIAHAPKDATDRRIDRILNYLNVSNLDLTVSQKHQPPVNNAVSPAFDAVKKRLISLELEVEDKSRSIATLKHQLQESRATTQHQAEDHSKVLKSQLTLQRKEYEATIKRHLTFIDKTLAEKETLVTQCTELAGQVKTIEAGVKSKLSALAEKHERDMKGARSIWEAGEKIRREKWMVTQSAKIKEQTIKGLEPEIQRMLASHKTQICMAEEKLREQWSSERIALLRSHEQQVATMRDQWMSERTRALDEERESARSRYAKQLERDEIEFAQCKRKWVAEMSEMRDQLIAQFREEQRTEENAHRKQTDDLRSVIDQERDSQLRALDDLRRRHAHELSVAVEQSRAEREAWQAAYQSKVEADIRVRERDFKDTLIRERDREIERVISRLEQESGSSNEDLVAQHRADIEQLRSRHADEILTLQDQWTVAMDKLVSMGRQVELGESLRRDLERELWSLKSTAEAKDRTLDELKSELKHYKSGESEIRKVVEESFHSELQRQEQLIAALKCERDRLKTEVCNVEHAAGERIIAVQQEKSDTLAMLEDRVKSTMASKDESLTCLRDQLDELKIRNGQLEILLERQRKELLM